MNEKMNVSFLSYRCSMCDSRFTTSSNITICPVCGHDCLEQVESMDVSDYSIVTSHYTLDDAIKDYKSKIKFRLFLPFLFRRKSTIHRIQKVFLPCVFYRAEVSGEIVFLCAEKIKGISAIPSQKYECGYKVNISFPNLLLCSFSKISDEMFSVIHDSKSMDLQFSDFSKYQNELFLYEDEDLDFNREKIKDKMMKYSMKIVRGDVPHSLKKLKENKLNSKIIQEEKVFIPVFMVDVFYRHKNYIYMMNANTGKSIVSISNSFIMIFLFSICVFLGIFSLILLFLFII